jgi:hypothetical protein
MMLSSLPEWERLYTGPTTVVHAPLFPLLEAWMPRFAGKKTVPVWRDIVAVVVFVVVVVIVLGLTGVIHLFGS